MTDRASEGRDMPGEGEYSNVPSEGARFQKDAEVGQRLRAVFVDALELDAGVAVESLKYRDIEAWDSVGHMSLVAAIEDEFDLQLDTDQVIDLSSFKVALDLIEELRG
jgi:acyl carrier protein